ncbi:hypothetical protein HPB51_029681 [Rhipicephalus microplus]|uniref:CCHC-type domain-containing protein n=1 Tax=Rhipicephalus microplus TaxID=6941 RepID=A0A9J6CTG3_RHIMP|nr:hypothetical protein HPB51_029681 [Rhipicephalus microplus]
MDKKGQSMTSEEMEKAFNYWLKISPEKCQAVTEIVQMLHNSSLLIDDIEDNSLLRRGVPVAHHIFGVASTINSANYVYFLSLEKCLQLGDPQATTVFTEQCLELHRGQGMEIYWRDNYICPSEDDYITMVKRKSLESVADVIGHCRTFEALKTRRITTKFGRLANVTTVATVDVCQDSVPTDLSSTIRLIVREELRRHLYAPLNAREPPCDTPSTSINATSFEERSYSNRGPQLRAPPPASSYVEPPYAPHSRYGYNSHPPPFASQWEQSAAYPQHPATFPMPRERPVCYQCGVRGHIARFCPMRRNPRSTFPQRSATFAQRGQRLTTPTGPPTQLTSGTPTSDQPE